MFNESIFKDVAHLLLDIKVEIRHLSTSHHYSEPATSLIAGTFILFSVISLIVAFASFVAFLIFYFVKKQKKTNVLKLSGISKKLISPKKFYRLKGLTNKYGALTIFFFNALPLPSQLLSVILGVFRYNKTRFYVFFLFGQIVKYAAISVIYYFF